MNDPHDVISLRTYVERILDERAIQFRTEKEAHTEIHRILEVAITRADHLHETEKAAANEWRGALNDAQVRFAPSEAVDMARRDAIGRAEALRDATDHQFAALRDSVDKQNDAMLITIEQARREATQRIELLRDAVDKQFLERREAFDKQIDEIKKSHGDLRSDLSSLNGRLGAVSAILFFIIAAIGLLERFLPK